MSATEAVNALAALVLFVVGAGTVYALLVVFLDHADRRSRARRASRSPQRPPVSATHHHHDNLERK